MMETLAQLRYKNRGFCLNYGGTFTYPALVQLSSLPTQNIIFQFPHKSLKLVKWYY